MLRSSLSRFLPYPKRLEIVWCPFRGGQGRPGVELVPIRLMEAGLGSQLEGLGWAVRFDGHLQFQEFKPVDDTPFMGSKTPRLVSTASETIAKVVADHARQEGMGTVSGNLEQYPDAYVVWMDAHADSNTADTTKPGNMHRMPVSMLIGPGTKIPQFSWLKPRPHPSPLLYISLGDVDEDEKRLLREHWIGAVVKTALDNVNPGRELTYPPQF